MTGRLSLWLLARLSATAAATLLLVVPARPCIPLPRMKPVIYQHWTMDGEFALVMAESPDGFGPPGRRYQPSSEEEATLAEFPVSGIYRVGDTQPLREFEYALPRDRVVAFFNRGDSVHLVVRDGFGLSLYADSNEPIILDGVRESWVQAPWMYRLSVGWCSGGKGFDAELLRAAPTPQVRVQVLSSPARIYDATTGKLVRVEGDEFPEPVGATAAELKLRDIQVRLRTLIAERRWSEVQDALLGRMGRTYVGGCLHAERTEDMIEDDEPLTTEDFVDDPNDLEGIRPRALRSDLPHSSRVLLPDDPEFDLYRLDAGQALPFLCGEPATYDKFVEETDLEDRELWSLLSGPTVAVVSPAEYTDHDEGMLGGFVTLWSDAVGQWQVIGFALFSIPMAE